MNKLAKLVPAVWDPKEKLYSYSENFKPTASIPFSQNSFHGTLQLKREFEIVFRYFFLCTVISSIRGIDHCARVFSELSWNRKSSSFFQLTLKTLESRAGNFCELLPRNILPVVYKIHFGLSQKHLRDRTFQSIIGNHFGMNDQEEPIGKVFKNPVWLFEFDFDWKKLTTKISTPKFIFFCCGNLR